MFPAASATLILHFPVATDVTLNVFAGELCATVATAVLDEVAVQVVVPPSATVNFFDRPGPVNVILLGVSVTVN